MTAVVVTGRELHEAAAWASRVVPAKPTVPALGGLLLDAHDDQLRLTATDWDTWATITLPATVKDPGRLLLSARLLTDVAKLVARDVDVVLDDSAGEVQARSGRSQWSLPPLPVDDFPTPLGASPAVAEVDAEAFRTAIARVLPAVSPDRSIPFLASVRVEPGDPLKPNEPSKLLLVATDRYRLHVAEVLLLSGTAPEALVPPELLAAVARHNGAGPLELACEAGLFGVACDEFRLTGRQVDAEFPRWRPLLPPRTENHAVAEVAELLRVVDHVRVMAAPGDDDVVELTFADESIEASAFVGDRRARAEGPCTVHGDPLSATLRPQYVREALTALPASHVAVHVDRMRCLLLPCDPDGVVVDGVQVLVMGRKRPVR